MTDTKERKIPWDFQWLRLRAPNAAGMDSIPGLGTKISMPHNAATKKEKEKIPRAKNCGTMLNLQKVIWNSNYPLNLTTRNHCNP